MGRRQPRRPREAAADAKADQIYSSCAPFQGRALSGGWCMQAVMSAACLSWRRLGVFQSQGHPDPWVQTWEEALLASGGSAADGRPYAEGAGCPQGDSHAGGAASRAAQRAGVGPRPGDSAWMRDEDALLHASQPRLFQQRLGTFPGRGMGGGQLPLGQAEGRGDTRTLE